MVLDLLLVEAAAALAALVIAKAFPSELIRNMNYVWLRFFGLWFAWLALQGWLLLALVKRNGDFGAVLPLGPSQAATWPMAWRVCVAVAAMLLISLSLGLVGPTVSPDNLELYVSIVQCSQWPLAFLLGIVASPLMEEIIFRGYLQTAFGDTMVGRWGAAIVTAAVWSALHRNPLLGFVAIFLSGLCLSYLRFFTRSLRAGIAAHAIYNAIAFTSIKLALP